MSQNVVVETLTGAQVGPLIPALSELRCSVFREWPYLYAGDADYEAAYLQDFAKAKDSVLVIARDGERVIGAATAAPLISHTPEFIPLFETHGFQPDGVFYLGESVLDPAYRGHGLGHAFFDRREAAAAGYAHAAFCGVMRGDDDPRRPANARDLAPFWRKRGYAPVAGMIGEYDWREVGCDEEIAHPMQFWARAL